MRKKELDLIHRKIGAKVFYYRKLHGWTQNQLAQISGISISKISRVESGKYDCSIDTILILAKTFKIDCRNLIV